MRKGRRVYCVIGFLDVALLSHLDNKGWIYVHVHLDEVEENVS